MEQNNNRKPDYGNWIPMPFMRILYSVSAVLLLFTAGGGGGRRSHFFYLCTFAVYGGFRPCTLELYHNSCCRRFAACVAHRDHLYASVSQCIFI